MVRQEVRAGGQGVSAEGIGLWQGVSAGGIRVGQGVRVWGY